MIAGTAAAELLLQHQWPGLSAWVPKVPGKFNSVVAAHQEQQL
jgi:hypothetical protein